MGRGAGKAYRPGANTGIYKTTDGGANWRRVLEPLNESTGAVDLALDFANPRILYAAMWTTSGQPGNYAPAGW